MRSLSVLVASLAIALAAGCAAPLLRPAVRPSTAEQKPARAIPTMQRPAVGVAFGGGSARGIAHVGVIKWLEEHRIPIDVAAGTSMGGLIGGAYATGMDAAELEIFITSLDWDLLFGASSFEYKNIRRKTDARAYPSRLEFGLRGGVVPPSALNTGEQVELLLSRITGPYFEMASFDELPTPFRTVAVDLISAQPVVLRSGSLAEAMRATMSLPLVFPPVDLNGQVLIDGGAMNNVPADVVRDMGADRVIAVNVGDLSNPDSVNTTMFAVAGSSIDAMMRASTRRVIAGADVIVGVPLKEYGSLDWRRASDLIAEGYKTAESMRDQLLPLSVDEATFNAWRSARQARRKTTLPQPSFVDLEGFVSRDADRLNVLMARHIGVPVDVAAIEQDIAIVGGLDRYQTVTWNLTRDASRGVGLAVHGRVKNYAPPFMMLGFNLENTTSSDFRITTTARYLAFDTFGSSSEWRIDGTIGSDPGLATEIYRPVGSTPLFVAPYAAVGSTMFNLIDEDVVIARYKRTAQRAGLNIGLNLGAQSDVRIGAYIGRASANVEVGDPGFPELSGKESAAELRWRLDSQDSPVMPSRGIRAEALGLYIIDGPDLKANDQPVEGGSQNSYLTQFSITANEFWSRGPRSRVFLYGSMGTSFDGAPLQSNEFSLGTPFRLGAYDFGELRGSHYYVATGGYARQIGQLPDFMGGPVFVGTWLENGDAFDHFSDAKLRTNMGAGVIMDTIIGPVLIGGSWSFDGRWRSYLGVGRIFR